MDALATFQYLIVSRYEVIRKYQRSRVVGDTCQPMVHYFVGIFAL